MVWQVVCGRRLDSDQHGCATTLGSLDAFLEILTTMPRAGSYKLLPRTEGRSGRKFAFVSNIH